MTANSPVTVREATLQDASEILALIKELAAFEDLSNVSAIFDAPRLRTR